MKKSQGTVVYQSALVSRTRRAVSSEETSINAQLLLRAGYVDRLMAGVYSWLPLGLRILKNIEQIVREEMEKIGSMEILLPALHPQENWEKTGRWTSFDSLYRIIEKDENGIALGSTHEEVVTPLIGGFLRSYRDFPASVFQIQTKFRKEARPRSGVLRGREFRMKDMYSFHTDEKCMSEYYERAKEAYMRVFNRCGLGEVTYRTYASGGAFSSYSHEFQSVCETGEDTIFVNEEKRLAINKDIYEEVKNHTEFSDLSFVEQRGIEVGNIFNLGTRFSEAFGLNYMDCQGNHKPFLMGCYGIGTTRIVGAVVEIHNDENGMIWPEDVAPFDIHLIVIGKGEVSTLKAQGIAQELSQLGFEVLFDDREISAGERLVEADLVGIPTRIIISERGLQDGSAEIKKRNEPIVHNVKWTEVAQFVSR